MSYLPTTWANIFPFRYTTHTTSVMLLQRSEVSGWQNTPFA